MERLETELERALVGRRGEDASAAVIMEVTPGAGGDEAKLFASEILRLELPTPAPEYVRLGYCCIEGLKLGEARIAGEGVYRLLKYEGGIHRVQRVPATERGGRTHTSTVSVVLLPEPPKVPKGEWKRVEVEVVLDKKDIRIEVTTSSGPGGQHVNKTESCVRVYHLASGLMVECQETRSQNENRERALRRLSAMLYERELAAASAKLGASRKLQAGNKDRSEKIRTYNFQENRVTDHRIKQSFHKLPQILEGGEAFDELISSLQEFSRSEQLQELFDSAQSDKPS